MNDLTDDSAPGRKVQSLRPSKNSPEALPTWKREMILRDAERPGPITDPQEVAALLQEIENERNDLPSQDWCLRQAAILLAMWPKPPDHDMKMYLAAVASIFIDYPRRAVLRAVSVKHGLPGKLRFFPSLAEITDELARAEQHDDDLRAALLEIRSKQRDTGERRVGNVVCDTRSGAEQIADRPGGPFNSRIFHEVGRRPSAPAAQPAVVKVEGDWRSVHESLPRVYTERLQDASDSPED